MGKFLKMMSQNDSQTLRSRAQNLDTQASIAQRNLINTLKNKKATLELKVQDLTDFAPDNTQSLRPAAAGWDPNKWVRELQEAKIALYEVNIEIKIAESTFAEFFEDEEEHTGDAE